jgi:hypothetical protein
MNKERSVINKGIPNKENPNLESKEIGLLLSVCEADTPCGTKVRRMTNCVTWSFMLMGFLWLLYVPPGLTFRNSTFCPHTGFMCFVWI